MCSTHYHCKYGGQRPINKRPFPFAPTPEERARRVKLSYEWTNNAQISEYIKDDVPLICCASYPDGCPCGCSSESEVNETCDIQKIETKIAISYEGFKRWKEHNRQQNAEDDKEVQETFSKCLKKLEEE